MLKTEEMTKIKKYQTLLFNSCFFVSLIKFESEKIISLEDFPNSKSQISTFPSINSFRLILFTSFSFSYLRRLYCSCNLWFVYLYIVVKSSVRCLKQPTSHSPCRQINYSSASSTQRFFLFLCTSRLPFFCLLLSVT